MTDTSSKPTPTVTFEIFTPDQMTADPILRFFHFSHLPPHLQAISVKFYELVCHILATVPKSEERDVTLRKLLEAKDAAVRASLS